MIQDRVLDRLHVHTGMLDQVLSALHPGDQDGSGLDELVQTLTDLTVAVTECTQEVAALRSIVLARFHCGDIVA